MSFSDALRALADLTAGGGTLRSALIAWPEHVQGRWRAPLQELARRLRLGTPIAAAVHALVDHPHGAYLRALLVGYASAGGPPGELLRGLALAIERREHQAAQASAAAAAARASNRLLIGLPLLAVPLFALSGTPVFDRLGAGLLGCGAGLALLGARWVGKLTPVPAPDGPAVRIAELVAPLVRAGTDLRAALHAAAGAEPDPAVRLAHAWVRLGRPWAESLIATGHPDLVSLGHLVARCSVTGVPIAASLERFVRGRRAVAELDFERRSRAAPVRMVVPLVACGLPAFGLLVIAPMLRELPTI